MLVVINAVLVDGLAAEEAARARSQADAIAATRQPGADAGSAGLDSVAQLHDDGTAHLYISHVDPKPNPTPESNPNPNRLQSTVMPCLSPLNSLSSRVCRAETGAEAEDQAPTHELLLLEFALTLFHG